VSGRRVGREPTGHIAASDCERCRRGLVAQPVNTVSSLAFVAAGALTIRSLRRRRVDTPGEAAVGWAAMAAGLGSVAYHGPGTAFGRYVHDASLLNLLASLTLADGSRASGRPVPRSALAIVPVVSSVAAHPRTSMGAQAAFGIAAGAAEAARVATEDSSRAIRVRDAAEAVTVGVGALAHVLGRSGGPWCRPDSLVQPHALWHVAMAATVYLRSSAT